MICYCVASDNILYEIYFANFHQIFISFLSVSFQEKERYFGRQICLKKLFQNYIKMQNNEKSL